MSRFSSPLLLLLASSGVSAQTSTAEDYSINILDKELKGLEIPVEFDDGGRNIEQESAISEKNKNKEINEILNTTLRPLDNFDIKFDNSEESYDKNIADNVTYDFKLNLDNLEYSFPDKKGEIRNRFMTLSSLERGRGLAGNRAFLAAWLRGDQQILRDILISLGFLDASVHHTVQQRDDAKAKIEVRLFVEPGALYTLGRTALLVQDPEARAIAMENFSPKQGDPITAESIVAAEAKIAVALPQRGYPFVKIGQRDILLDEVGHTGDYTLPIDPGPRSHFGEITPIAPAVFDSRHIWTLARFKADEIFDSEKLKDLREALVATGLLSTVSIEPVLSSRRTADGSALADLRVYQEPGPPRTIAASVGYETGQGFRADASWTHRNLFPPEGALIASAVLGTQEQALAVEFKRSNAGRRDRTVSLSFSGQRKDYDAFDAFTGRLAGSISYNSTPLWQKPINYALGFELLATHESLYDPKRSIRERELYYVVAAPTEVEIDQSNSLTNPTSGFRVKLRVSPETSLGNGWRLYVRSMLEASYYQSVTAQLVLASRVRMGAIAGTGRDSLAPSRRYYGGGGGSVRGFGFLQLGPKDSLGRPVGGRSLNEAAVEARLRFGDFGAVAFVDAGQVYESSIPRFNSLRVGAGLGARFYTNFGPIRLDLATPLGRKQGESKLAVYVSIGQAF